MSVVETWESVTLIIHPNQLFFFKRKSKSTVTWNERLWGNGHVAQCNQTCTLPIKKLQHSQSNHIIDSMLERTGIIKAKVSNEFKSCTLCFVDQCFTTTNVARRSYTLKNQKTQVYMNQQQEGKPMSNKKLS